MRRSLRSSYAFVFLMLLLIGSCQTGSLIRLPELGLPVDSVCRLMEASGLKKIDSFPDSNGNLRDLVFQNVWLSDQRHAGGADFRFSKGVLIHEAWGWKIDPFGDKDRPDSNDFNQLVNSLCSIHGSPWSFQRKPVKNGVLVTTVEWQDHLDTSRPSYTYLLYSSGKFWSLGFITAYSDSSIDHRNR